MTDNGEAGVVTGSVTEQVVETFGASGEGWNSVDVDRVSLRSDVLYQEFQIIMFVHSDEL